MSDPEFEPTRINEPVPEAGFAGGPPTTTMPRPGPPDEPPPDRRLWIIVGLLALIIVVLLAVLLLGGDDDDDDASTDATTTSSSTTSSSTTSTTTASSTTGAPTTTEAPPVTLDPGACTAAGANGATPGLAAETVYDAWVLGDQACASRLMNDAALDELFSRDGSGANDTFQGCTEEDEPDPHADCAFTYEGGSTHYLMNFSPTDGWKVFDVTQIAD